MLALHILELGSNSSTETIKQNNVNKKIFLQHSCGEGVPLVSDERRLDYENSTSIKGLIY